MFPVQETTLTSRGYINRPIEEEEEFRNECIKGEFTMDVGDISVSVGMTNRKFKKVSLIKTYSSMSQE